MKERENVDIRCRLCHAGGLANAAEFPGAPSSVERLLTRQYAEALELFTRAHQLDPTNTTVKTNIQRLEQLGYRLDKEVS